MPVLSEQITLTEPSVSTLGRWRTGVAFFDGGRFAGQCRLVHPQLRHLVQAQVGRHQVAGFEQHHAAGHQVLGLHHLHLPAGAAHGGLRRRQLLQRLQGLVGAPFLPEADGRVEQHDQQDDHRAGQVADQARQHRRRQQHDDHEVAKLVQQALPRWARRRLGQAVGAVALLADHHLVGRQAGVKLHAQVLRQVGSMLRVGIGRGGGNPGWGVCRAVDRAGSRHSGG